MPGCGTPRRKTEQPIRNLRTKAGCSALLGLVVITEIYYDFSSSVSFFQIADSLRDITQAVTPVDDRGYLPGLHEHAQDGQVFFGYSRNKRDELLANEP